MKASKRILSVVLALVLVMSLSVTAFAKTSSDEIAAPGGDYVVFSIQIGTRTVNFTWDEVNGKGEFKTTTDSYAAKIDDKQSTQEWTGVMLVDLLARAESKLGIKLADDDKISAIAADGYKSVFTVGDVRDADNRYMVAPDPVSNYDGDTVYANSYVRIVRGDETAMSNTANIRCLTGIEITDASGNAITTGTKTAGGDVENAVFYIAVKESEDSAFKFYYYTLDELKAYDNIYNFDYTDHSVDKIVSGRGASLKNLLADIADSNITDDMIVQYAESDGYHADAATAIEDSAYKDMVAWLGSEHVTSGGDTAAAVETVVCYDSWTTYDNPDENNVNSTEWEDADLNSGYLRAYRQRGDANSAVIKTLMGVVVSKSGQEFSGKDGCTLTAQSVDGNPIRFIEPSTGIAYTSQSITGLVPGMKYTVKAPDIAGAVISGDAKKTITAESGTGVVVTFTYKENPYLTVNGTVYTLSSFEAGKAMTQTPSAEEVAEHGTPYGYYDAMYYRYNGIWLSYLVSSDVTVKGTDGSTLAIAQADLGKYFIASGYTASKSSTNVSEGKRYVYAYSAPQLLIPSDGTLVGEEDVGKEGNRMVTVAMKSVASVSGGESGLPFTDLDGYSWAEDAIETLYNAGIVNGQSADKYGPAASIKRGDFMLMLVRAYGLTADTTDNFEDVASGSYWYDAIATAKALGIAKGDGTNFNPGSSITRQEAMTLLCRTLEVVGKDLSSYTADLSAYSDGDSVASWAAVSVRTLVGAGVINGKDGAIDPMGSMTRAEMAVALCRALENLK